jgi:hypothetical protein
MNGPQIVTLEGPIDSARIVNLGPSRNDMFRHGYFFTLGAVSACSVTLAVLSALFWLFNLAKGWW